MDDSFIRAESYREVIPRVKTVLDRCRQHNITISWKKLDIGSKITFAGHVISSEGERPDPEKLKVIKPFPRPSNVTEVKSFMGLANRLTNCNLDIAHMGKSLRALT